LNIQIDSDLGLSVTLQPAEKPKSRLQKSWSFARRYSQISFGGTLLLILVLVSILAPFLGTVDPRAIDTVSRLKPPSVAHWFGTDMLGRDLYSRVLYGGRNSLLIGFSVMVISAIIGTLIGLVSAYLRWLDGVIMRIMDGLMSIPSMLLAIALMSLIGASLNTVITAISIIEIPRIARLIRGTVLSLREQPYVEAAITSGSGPVRIIFRHLLPGTVSPLIIQSTYIWAVAMIIETMLSFIGAGTPPTVPSWGNIMSDGRALWQVKPYIVFIPGVFLTLTVLAINVLGDGLRDAFDPRIALRN
jgi:peptide/nickel transport system permease protein